MGHTYKYPFLWVGEFMQGTDQKAETQGQSCKLFGIFFAVQKQLLMGK